MDRILRPFRLFPVERSHLLLAGGGFKKATALTMFCLVALHGVVPPFAQKLAAEDVVTPSVAVAWTSPTAMPAKVGTTEALTTLSWCPPCAAIGVYTAALAAAKWLAAILEFPFRVQYGRWGSWANDHFD